MGRGDNVYKINESAKNISGYKLSDDRLYAVWNSMIGRCYNLNARSYKNYGARGIDVCDEWRSSFFEFKGWAISAGYDYSKDRKDQTLDRIDNNGGYCPQNCKWVTASENNSHRRYLGRRQTKYNRLNRKVGKNDVFYEINGKTKRLLDWCEMYGMKYQTVQYRIKIVGMTPYEALTSEKKYPGGSGRPKKEG